MAQRKSGNRKVLSRRSRRSSNLGFLDENTNVVENNDPLWFDRTSVRPSTSLVISKHANSSLNTNSTVNASHISEKWYNNLTQSDSSKLMEAAVKNNYRQSKEQNHSIQPDSYAESESDQEPQRKRGKLEFFQKSNNKSDKSNIFSKALEKTTDSHTRNLTTLVHESNESESTNDDSKTVQRLRPKIFRTNEHTERNSDKFDNIFDDNNISEKIQNHTQSLSSTNENYNNEEQFITPKSSQKFLSTPKSILKRKIEGNSKNLSTPEKVQEFEKRSDEIIVHDNSSNEKSLENKTKPVNDSNHNITKKDKKNSALNSQKNKSASDTNLFDAVFDSENEDSNENIERDELPEKNSENNQENNENNENYRSSISINTRETRSSSTLNNDIQKKSQTQPLKRKSNLVVNTSKDVTADNFSINQKNAIHSTRSRSILNNTKEDDNVSVYEINKIQSKSFKTSSSQQNNFNDSYSTENLHVDNQSKSDNPTNNKSNKNVVEKTSTKSKQLSSIESSDDEVDKKLFSQNSLLKNNRSQIQSLKRKSSLAVNTSKDASWNISNSSQDSNVRFTRSSQRISNVTKEDDMISISQMNKMKTRLSKESSSSQQNVVDQINLGNNSKSTKKFNTNSEQSNSSLFNNKSSKHPMKEITTESIDQSIILKNNKSQAQSLKGKLSLAVNTSKDTSWNVSKNNQNSRGLSIESTSQHILNATKKDDVASTAINKTKSKILKSSSRQQNIDDQISDDSSRESKNSTIDSDNENSNVSEKNKSNCNVEQSMNVTNSEEDVEYENDIQQEEADAETSSIPKHIRRTVSRLFQKTKATDDSNNASNVAEASTSKDSFRNIEQLQTTNSKRSKENDTTMRDNVNQSSAKSNAFVKEPQITLHRVLSEAAEHTPNDSLTENQASKQRNQHLQKSKNNNSIDRKSNATTGKKKLSKVINENELMLKFLKKSSVKIDDDKDEERRRNSENSVETSSDITPESKTSKKRRITASPASNYNSDDLLSTPHPAQSTLNPYGMPVARIPHFSFRNSIVPPETPVTSSSPAKRLNNDAVAVAEEEEPDVEVDVMNNSDDSVGDVPLLSRRAEDIPSDTSSQEAENESVQSDKVPAEISMSSSVRPQKFDDLPTASSISEAKWAEIRKRTEVVKKRIEAQEKRREAKERERAQRKARIDAKVKRLAVQHEAEKKRQRKIASTDKAYFVDGQLYKQPKLPRPKPWVTQRLYKYLWKCMEPTFGLETRIYSERFVLKLSKTYDIIIKRKKYENYEAELNGLLVTMAELNIIQDRYDFYRFCSEFMPPEFNIKAVPMMLPGNTRNIPYNPDLVHKPILNRRNEESDEGREDDEL